MSLFAVLALVGVALVLLYLLLRSQSASHATSLRSLTIWLSRPAVILSQACLYISTACKQGFVRGLAWPQQADTDEDQHIIGKLVARLLYLLIACVLVLGEAPLAILRLAAYFNLQVTPLNVPLDIFLALSSLVMPGVWLCLLLEASCLLPRWACVLPAIKNRFLSWCLGILATILLVVSSIVTFAFFTWGQCVINSLACASDGSMLVYTGGFFGGLLYLAAAFSLAGGFLGLVALVCLLLGVLYCVFDLLHLAFGIIGDSVYGLSRVHRDPFIEPVPYSLVALTPKQTPLLLISANAQKEQPGIISEEELLMNDPLRNIAIIGCGPHSARIVKKTVEVAQDKGMAGCLLAAGIVDQSRPYDQNALIIIPGMRNLSPTHRQITEAGADESIMPMHTRLAYGINTRLVEAFAQRQGGIIIVVCDMSLMPDMLEPLTKLHKRLRKQKIVVLSELLAPDRRGERLLAAHQHFLSLAEDGPEGKSAEMTFVFDPRSELAIRAGEETQDEAIALSIISACVAPLHDERNVTFAEMVERLGDCSAIGGISCAIAAVASGEVHVVSRIAGAVIPGLANKGYGDISDLIVQAKTCIQDALHEHASLATPETVDLNSPVVFVVVDIPLSPADKRWKETTASITSYIKRTYRQVTGIVVHANAPAVPGMERQSYRCMATAFYALTTQAFMRTEASAVEETNEKPEVAVLQVDQIEEAPARMRRRANGVK